MPNASKRLSARFPRLTGHTLTIFAVSVFACGQLMMPAAEAQTAAVPPSTLGIDLNNDAARLSWSRTGAGENTRYGASVLHDTNRGTVVSGGFHITGNAATQQRPVNAGLGGKLYFASSSLPDVSDLLPADLQIADENGSGIGLGGFFESRIPNYDRLGFGGHLYYVPDVLAFGDLKQLTDIWLYGSYSVLRQGDVYLGWRNVKADYKGFGDFTFDTGVHLGFTLKF